MDTAIILTMKINFENFDLMAFFAWRVTYVGQGSSITMRKPYFRKHLYSIHAAQRNLKSPAQKLECFQYITPTLTSYLAEVF